MQKLSPDDPTRIGPYAIIGRIGQGGMGCVYLGVRNGKLAAVKVMAELYANIPEFRARFRREIDVVKRIEPGFTAQILEHGEDGMRLWCASEYVPGPTLAEAVQASIFTDDALVNLAYSLCSALVPVHEAGVVHRDLKPANIILGPKGVRIVDFGIAADSDAPALTMTGQVLGTASYMSPEQVAGGVPTPKWDVFAYGCVLAYAATRRPPYTGNNRMEIMLAIADPNRPPDLTDVPMSLRALIESCLQHNASNRPTLETIMRRLPTTRPETAASTKWMPPPVTAKVQAATRVMTRLTDDLAQSSKKPTFKPKIVARKSRKGLVAWLAAVTMIVGALGYGSTLSDDEPTSAPTPTVSQRVEVEVPPPAFTVSSLKSKGNPKVTKVVTIDRGLRLTLAYSGSDEQRKTAIANSCLKLGYANDSYVILRPSKPAKDTPAGAVDFWGALDFPGNVYYMPSCPKRYGVAGGQWLGKNKVSHDGFFGDGSLLPVVDAYTKNGKLKVVLPDYIGYDEARYKAMCLKTADGPHRVALLTTAINRNRNYVLLTFNAPIGTIHVSCSSSGKVSYKGKGAAIP